MSVNAFDVFKRMSDMNDRALKLAPLGNIQSMKRVKMGTQVVIGVGEDVLVPLIQNQLVGGLILCDRTRFEQVQKEMEAAK